MLSVGHYAFVYCLHLLLPILTTWIHISDSSATALSYFNLVHKSAWLRLYHICKSNKVFLHKKSRQMNERKFYSGHLLSFPNNSFSQYFREVLYHILLDVCFYQVSVIIYEQKFQAVLLDIGPFQVSVIIHEQNLQPTLWRGALLHSPRTEHFVVWLPSFRIYLLNFTCTFSITSKQPKLCTIC